MDVGFRLVWDLDGCGMWIGVKFGVGFGLGGGANPLIIFNVLLFVVVLKYACKVGIIHFLKLIYSTYVSM